MIRLVVFVHPIKSNDVAETFASRNSSVHPHNISQTTADNLMEIGRCNKFQLQQRGRVARGRGTSRDMWPRLAALHWQST